MFDAVDDDADADDDDDEYDDSRLALRAPLASASDAPDDNEDKLDMDADETPLEPSWRAAAAALATGC